MEQKIFDVLHHLSALHERIEVLHERDVDYDTRLHNSYFDIAKACSERELLKNQIQRDATRQAGKEKRYEELVVRLRKERDALKDLCKHLQAEKAREQVKGDEVAQMWVQEAREGKMALRPVRDDDQQRANGTKRKRDADDAGGKEVPGTYTPQEYHIHSPDPPCYIALSQIDPGRIRTVQPGDRPLARKEMSTDRPKRDLSESGVLNAFKRLLPPQDAENDRPVTREPSSNAGSEQAQIDLEELGTLNGDWEIWNARVESMLSVADALCHVDFEPTEEEDREEEEVELHNSTVSTLHSHR
ncbi:hypothetical protein QFC22_001153 [Naganishia vaughanmartiniae]|uniref:Uncharacterized protein n=1 Tax=Naganishia vaughanmartiniae TaxID=1424756 RepID=A0ACC2XL55_9TREE|nr:hypothetical protein QFC22_001153 [Naganishia vaughanmartiniae]